jgi:hypothetical protein
MFPKAPRPWPHADRGFVLWLFAIAFLLVGLFGYVLTEPTDTQRHTLVIPFHYLHISATAWGVLFIACGTVAGSLAYSRNLDRYGYNTLTTLSAFWCLCYATGVPLGGSLRGIGGTAVWGLFALMLYRLAGYDDSLDCEAQVPSP